MNRRTFQRRLGSSLTALPPSFSHYSSEDWVLVRVSSLLVRFSCASKKLLRSHFSAPPLMVVAPPMVAIGPAWPAISY